MTLEELKNKTVTLTYEETFKLSDNFDDEYLQECIDDSDSDESLIKDIKDTFDSSELFYSFGDESNYKVNIE